MLDDKALKELVSQSPYKVTYWQEYGCLSFEKKTRPFYVVFLMIFVVAGLYPALHALTEWPDDPNIFLIYLYMLVPFFMLIGVIRTWKVQVWKKKIIWQTNILPFYRKTVSSTDPIKIFLKERLGTWRRDTPQFELWCRTSNSETKLLSHLPFHSDLIDVVSKYNRNEFDSIYRTDILAKRL